jgi:Ran GTPase-activating protein (RanGAP) involved in mRNA processing and transport
MTGARDSCFYVTTDDRGPPWGKSDALVSRMVTERVVNCNCLRIATVALTKPNVQVKILTLDSFKLSYMEAVGLGDTLHQNSSLEVLTFHRITFVRDNPRQLGLALSSSSSLKIVEFCCCKFPTNYLEQLAGALQGNTSIETLVFQNGSGIGNYGAGVLSEAVLALKALKVLHFISCGITSRGVTDLVGCLIENKTMLELSLMDNGIGNDGIRLLSRFLARDDCSLKRLILNDCGIDDVGAGDLGRALESNHCLLYLDVGNNPCILTQAFADGLKQNTTLETLLLERCGIVPSGLAHLVSALEGNKTLLRLCLGENWGIGNSAVDLLPGSSLKVLSVNDCRINDEGAALLGQLLKTNGSLQELNIYCSFSWGSKYCIGRSGVVSLADGLSWNTTLLGLDVEPRDDVVLRYRKRWPKDLSTSHAALILRINGYLRANRFLGKLKSRSRCSRQGCVVCSNENDGVSHWPRLYAGVADHPAALHKLLKEHYPGRDQLTFFGKEYQLESRKRTIDLNPCPSRKKHRSVDFDRQQRNTLSFIASELCTGGPTVFFWKSLLCMTSGNS